MGGEHTFVDIDVAAGVVEAMVRDLDVATLSGAAATRLVERLVVCERVVAAARSRAAARAADANQWRHAGQRDEAAFVAGLTGTTPGAAAAELATTRRLAGLTATRAARDAGVLSDLAAREVASAAAVDPGAEQALLEHATRDDAAALKRRCAAVRAAAERDEAAARERIRRARRFRSWTDQEGGWCFAGRGLPEDGGALLAAMKAHQDEAFVDHRRRGVHESTEAYAYDALMALAGNPGGHPGAASKQEDARQPDADAPRPSASGGTAADTTSGHGNARRPVADAPCSWVGGGPGASPPGPPVPDHLVGRARAARRAASSPGETGPRRPSASEGEHEQPPTPVPAALVGRARAARRGAALPALDATGPCRAVAGADDSGQNGVTQGDEPRSPGPAAADASDLHPAGFVVSAVSPGKDTASPRPSEPSVTEHGAPVDENPCTKGPTPTHAGTPPAEPPCGPGQPNADAGPTIQMPALAPDDDEAGEPTLWDDDQQAGADHRGEDPGAASPDPAAMSPPPGHVCPRPGPRTKVIVLVDHAALVRGNTVPGEVCEIAGVGPIPVATARDLARDAFLAAVVTDGRDVLTVAHLGRSATAHQRSALEARGMCCAVPGCGSLHRLEIDHVDGWAITRRTALDQLDWLCRFHHGMKTNRSYRLAGPPGARTWHPPGEQAPTDTG